MTIMNNGLNSTNDYLAIVEPSTEAGKLLMQIENNKVTCSITIETDKIGEINLDVSNLISIRKFLKEKNKIVIFKFFYETSDILDLLNPQILGCRITAEVFLSVGEEIYGNSANFEGNLIDVEIKNITSKESIIILEFSSNAH